MARRNLFSRHNTVILTACLVLAGAGTSATLTNAQTPPAAPRSASPQELQAEADALFRRMLVKPNDLDAAFRFSEIESGLGDYEAAIGALERMLFYNNGLDRVKLELGLLYFKLGSYEQARSYFSAALDGGPPGDVRQRITSFLREIDRRLSVHQFAGFAQIGLRSQSNANAGPDSAIVRALGFAATLDPKFTRKRDGNVFATSRLSYIYDFENQRGDVWETNYTGYNTRQFKYSSLNLGLVELDTGPRLTLGEASGLTVRPYAIGNVVTLGDRPYLAAAGGGVSARMNTDFGLTLEPGIEARARGFKNSTSYPTATDQQGNQFTASLAINAPLAFVNGLKWQSRLSYVRISARNKAYSADQVGIEVSLPYEFDMPFGQSGQRWTFAPFASYAQTNYAQVNPIVDPLTKRRDREWHAGATLDMALYQNFGFAIQAQYQRIESSLANYRTHNFIVSGGPTVRF